MCVQPNESAVRVERFRRLMEQQNVEVAVLVHPPDIFYFAGIALFSALIVPLEKEPILLVQINHTRGVRESWVEDVRPSFGISTIAQTLKKLSLARSRVGIELDVIPANYYRRFSDALPQVQLVDISPALLQVRMIKSQSEINLMKNSARVSALGFEECRKVLCPGMTEWEIAKVIKDVECYYHAQNPLSLRAWNQVFDFGMVATGDNSYEVSGYWLTATGRGISQDRPYGPSSRPIQEGELVTINKGVNILGYHVDQARTFVVGEPTDEQQVRYEALKSIQDAAFMAVRPGAAVSDIYTAARDKAVYLGYEKYFMTRALYDFEYVGHGVGIEMDEPPLIGPKSKVTLQPGMVLALEPKLIIPGWGGLDIEDTLVVTASGAEWITYGSKEL